MRRFSSRATAQRCDGSVFEPDADDDARIAQLVHAEDVEVVADHRPPLHILADLGGDAAQHVGDAVGVLAIADRDVDDGEGEVARHVGHRRHRAERDDVQAAIERAQLDRTDRQLLDHAGQPADLHDVADRDGILEQQEDAGDDVAHQRLRTEADGDADDTGTGDQRRDVHADLGEYPLPGSGRLRSSPASALCSRHRRGATRLRRRW